jgi:lipopolysaccharide/colanic/teichoic acid biosynthesis glycosyltransferase
MKTIAALNSSTRLKRAIDVAGALAATVLFAPVMLAAAVSIFATMGRPIFFRQKRTGLNGEIFTLVKFRTMREGAHLPDAVRMTASGRLLRNLSVDELPQLWNVLRGEMSLVGPRPLLPEYLPRYTAGQRRRHDAKPGITGWAQIHGRNALTWDEKFKLDAWYVDHATNRLDLLILLRTVHKVLSRDGINQRGSATATPFCPPDFEQSEPA